MKLLAAIFWRLIPKTFIAMAILGYSKEYNLNPTDSIEDLFNKVAPE